MPKWGEWLGSFQTLFRKTSLSHIWNIWKKMTHSCRRECSHIIIFSSSHVTMGIIFNPHARGHSQAFLGGGMGGWGPQHQHPAAQSLPSLPEVWLNWPPLGLWTEPWCQDLTSVLLCFVPLSSHIFVSLFVSDYFILVFFSVRGELFESVHGAEYSQSVDWNEIGPPMLFCSWIHITAWIISFK